MVEAQASMPDHMIIFTTGPIVFSSAQTSALEKHTGKVDFVIAFNIHLHVSDCI